jgi:hypothetical protein
MRLPEDLNTFNASSTSHVVRACHDVGMTLLSIAMIVIGLAVFSFGTLRLLDANGGARAVGTIIGTSTDGGSFLAPHRGASFTFTAKDGTEHSVRSPTGTESGSAVGTTVQVRYDSAKPADARIVPTFKDLLGFFVVGDVLLIGGILLLVL